MVDQRQQRIPVFVDIGDQDRLLVPAELGPGQLLYQLFERADAARQRHEGVGAVEHFQHQAQILHSLATHLNVGPDTLLASVEKLAQTTRQLEKELGEQKRKSALHQLDDLFVQAKTIKGVKAVVGEVSNVDREGLRQLVDSLRQKLGTGVVALGIPEDGKVALIVGVTKDLTAKVHAGKLIQALAKQVGGSGGGRPDLAEAGGKDTSALKSALQSVPALLEPLL